MQADRALILSFGFVQGRFDLFHFEAQTIAIKAGQHLAGYDFIAFFNKNLDNLALYPGRHGRIGI